MTPEQGLLIVNADDWGYNERTTRAIAECHAAGGLTSTTAMMFMRDSEGAARISREHPRLGIGLHLNLLEAYSEPSTPKSVRDRQQRVLGHFRRMRLRRWVYDPRLRRDVGAVIADQLERFQTLYGRPPTHVDGHHHCHMAANVLLSNALPTGTKIRSALSDAHRPTPGTTALRLARKLVAERRFRSTQYFFSITTAWPNLAGPPPMDTLGLSRSASVEVMVHPGFAHEYGPLRSEDWVGALDRLPTGTFDDLQPWRR